MLTPVLALTSLLFVYYNGLDLREFAGVQTRIETIILTEYVSMEGTMSVVNNRG